MEIASSSLIWLLAALAAGLLLACLGRERELTRLRQQLAQRDADLGGVRAELASSATRIAVLESQCVGVDEKMTGTFAALVQRALDSASGHFLNLASARLSPIQGEFDKFAAAVAALQTAHSHDLGTLKESIAQVLQAQSTLQEAVRTTNDATGQLRNALQNPRVAGNWGEISLDRIVELAGMSEYCDFDRQTGIRSSEGTSERPDLTIRLTGGLRIPVDAKTSATNYIRAVGESDETQRIRLLRQSACDLRSRITELRGRAYDRIEGYAGMTLLFVPNEAMLSSALAQEPSMIEDALRYGIVICSPLLLVCYLRAFANGWRIQKQTENSQEVARRGRMLYERLQSFFTVLGKVGKYLNHTVDKYNDAMTKMDNLLVPGREMGKLLELNGDLNRINSIDNVARTVSGGSDDSSALSVMTATPL